VFLLIKLHKIAGNIMGYLEAFDGSKAALDSDKILIVRGRSRKRINAENMAEELNGVMETLNAREIDMYSDESIVDYKLGSTGKAGFFVVMWKDKSNVGPCFVEIVISDTGE